MSKEKKFHQFIEELDQEEKALAWKKTQEQDALDNASAQQVSLSSVKRRGVAPWKKALVTSIVSIIVVGAGVLGGIKFFTKDESPSTRYCDTSMYEAIDAQITLKDRVEQENKNLLFLDWYTITDYYVNKVYKLKDSNQKIGYYEQIMDINTGSLVTIHIVERGYELATLVDYGKATKTDVVNSVQVNWKNMDDFSCCNFMYDDYKYYVVLEYPMEEDSILDIVEEMLLNV